MEIRNVAQAEVSKQVPGLVQNGKLTVVKDKEIYEVIHYSTIDDAQLANLTNQVPDLQRPVVTAALKAVREQSKQGALAGMAFFPAFMLAGYIILIVYFKSRGGYKAQVLAASSSQETSESIRAGAPVQWKG